MEQNELGFIEKIVSLNRVAKVVKGGRRFSFSALMVVGDGNGNVGFGLGKAQEVPEALRKATEHARKNMVKVPLIEGTLPYEILGEFGAGRVMLKPASRGTGIIAGGAVRAVMEAAGVNDVLAKAIGTNNPHNVLRATMAGLAALRSADAVSIGCTPNQKKTLDALGLRRREMVKTFPDNPAVRGMIAKVSHLVVEVTKA